MQKQFFEVRRKLNRETFLLYSLFFIVTALLLTCVHLVLSRIDWHRTTSDLSLTLNNQLAWDSEISITITSTLLIFIISCFLYKYFTTRRGDLIAKQLGATEITNNYSNPYYTAFNRAIIEMSISAGIAPPRAFILADDHTINAFAAGTTDQDAVIAITKGALESLTSSELKALVAHEVSHIANGDTRMNRKITAVIFGFMALTTIAYGLFRIGANLSRSSSNKKNNTVAIMLAFFVAALAVLVISKILELFGKIIQACLSRKREYYADSQAVVSMRETYPIYSLLNKLKSTQREVKNHHAENFGKRLSKKFGKSNAPEYQHFYFDHHSMFSFLATHPPIDKRLEAIHKMMNVYDRAAIYSNNKEKTLAELYGDNWTHYQPTEE